MTEGTWIATTARDLTIYCALRERIVDVEECYECGWSIATGVAERGLPVRCEVPVSRLLRFLGLRRSSHQPKA